MKELCRSKGMMIFVILVLGFLYINTEMIQKMENEENGINDVYISMNI